MIERLTRASAARARVCIFDFDGTLSLIRSGWMEEMTAMMVEMLAALRTGESESELQVVVEDLVWRLTGKETIHQMAAFADEVRRRGGSPLLAAEYKQIFLDRLHALMRHRLEDLRRGAVSPDKYLVPGARALMESLQARGLTLYLASGTDQPNMRAEADLLDISRYFEGRVYGALDDGSFSKRILIQRLIASGEFQGPEFLGFGDGTVETENIKEAGGVAVGVATAEPQCEAINPRKRRSLLNAGADFIIPHFLDRDELLAALFSDAH